MKKYLSAILVFSALVACTGLAKPEIVSGNNVQINTETNNGQINGQISNGNNSAIVGSGKSVSEIRKIGSFSELSVSAPVEIQLSRENKSFTVVAESNIVRHVKTFVEGRSLKIALAPGSYQLNRKITIYVPVRTINAIEANGQAVINDNGSFKGNSISIEASGQSQIILDEWRFNSSSKVDVSGQSKVIVSINKIDDVDISGQSNIKLFGANQIGNLSVSGQSEAQVQGSPTITNQDISGQSELSSF